MHVCMSLVGSGVGWFRFALVCVRCFQPPLSPSWWAQSRSLSVARSFVSVCVRTQRRHGALVPAQRRRATSGLAPATTCACVSAGAWGSVRVRVGQCAVPSRCPHARTAEGGHLGACAGECPCVFRCRCVGVCVCPRVSVRSAIRVPSCPNSGGGPRGLRRRVSVCVSVQLCGGTCVSAWVSAQRHQGALMPAQRRRATSGLAP